MAEPAASGSESPAPDDIPEGCSQCDARHALACYRRHQRNKLALQAIQCQPIAWQSSLLSEVAMMDEAKLLVWQAGAAHVQMSHLNYIGSCVKAVACIGHQVKQGHCHDAVPCSCALHIMTRWASSVIRSI